MNCKFLKIYQKIEGFLPKNYSLIIDNKQKGGGIMKKRNKALSLVLFVVIMLTFSLSIFADGIAPYYNNTVSTNTVFDIDENGEAIVTFICRGIRGTTTKIVVETKIERKSGSSWVQVANASWTDQSTVYYCSGVHSIQLTQGGTYKATVTYTVSGSGGENDVIVDEIERTY